MQFLMIALQLVICKKLLLLRRTSRPSSRRGRQRKRYRSLGKRFEETSLETRTKLMGFGSLSLSPFFLNLFLPSEKKRRTNNTTNTTKKQNNSGGFLCFPKKHINRLRMSCSSVCRPPVLATPRLSSPRRVVSWASWRRTSSPRWICSKRRISPRCRGVAALRSGVEGLNSHGMALGGHDKCVQRKTKSDEKQRFWDDLCPNSELWQTVLLLATLFLIHSELTPNILYKTTQKNKPRRNVKQTDFRC